MQEKSQLESDKQDVRREFALRLRSLRAARGYATARSLAKALRIDENRYTRYERAEVEPDLGLLRRICEVLSVTPNELLGPAMPCLGQPPIAGFGESSAVEMGKVAPPPSGSGGDLMAWKLSCLVAGASATRGNAQTEGSEAAPLALLNEAMSLMHEIMSQPLAAFARILRDPAVQALDVSAAQQVHDLILGLTDALAMGALGRDC